MDETLVESSPETRLSPAVLPVWTKIMSNEENLAPLKKIVVGQELGIYDSLERFMTFWLAVLTGKSGIFCLIEERQTVNPE